MSEHVGLVLSEATLDVYAHRSAMERALRRRLYRFHGTVLDVGAGLQPYRELLLADPSRAERYVALDLPATRYRPPELEWNGETIPLEDNSVDCALATEVLEHCPEPARVLDEVFRVLRPRGFLFLTVPFLWPLHDVPHDEYRYTPFSLRRQLEQAGFTDVELEALGGWDASLAQLLGLWVRRRPLPAAARRAFSLLALPAVRVLLARDRPSIAFEESAMLTGIAGTASKR